MLDMPKRDEDRRVKARVRATRYWVYKNGEPVSRWRYDASCTSCRWYWGHTMPGGPIPWEVVHEVAGWHTHLNHRGQR